MSGPYDVPDDPEDVTLWAGRLRPWPAAPSPSDGGDDTADEDTAVSVRSAEVDDTVRVVRHEPSDDTIRVARDAAAPDAEIPTVDETTAPGRRRTPSLPVEPGPVSPPEPAPASAAAAPEHAPASAAPAPEHAPASAAPAPEPDPASEGPTGDTAAGTRRARTRPRVATESFPSADPVSPPREARVPSDTGHEVYRPRRDEAIRVARSAPSARAADAPDAADVRPQGVRRGRGRGVVLVVAVVLVVVGAAVGLFLLMG